ncbi:MAG: J domain-containing protein [Clostridiales bacterium]|nr:J domain-containing protein [Clostridiales bacterium]
MENDFEILGLREGATSQDVRTAFRSLARRWHPDRFMAGPEREWASDRMAEINRAYRSCLSSAKSEPTDDREQLERARKLIDDGQFGNARQVLMEISTRRAEWNYLFGLMLMHRREFEKALIYLSVAAHQMPDEPKYQWTEKLARGMNDAKRRPRFGRFQR